MKIEGISITNVEATKDTVVEATLRFPTFEAALAWAASSAVVAGQAPQTVAVAQAATAPAPRGRAKAETNGMAKVETTPVASAPAPAPVQTTVVPPVQTTVVPQVLLQPAPAGALVQPSAQQPVVAPTNVAPAPAPAPQPAPVTAAGPVPAELASATSFRQVMAYMLSQGLKDVPSIVAQCNAYRDGCPAIARLSGDLTDRVGRALEVLLSENQVAAGAPQQ